MDGRGKIYDGQTYYTINYQAKNPRFHTCACHARPIPGFFQFNKPTQTHTTNLNAQKAENIDKDFEIVATSRAKGQLSDIIINMTDVDWED
mgnify:FL=1